MVAAEAGQQLEPHMAGHRLNTISYYFVKTWIKIVERARTWGD